MASQAPSTDANPPTGVTLLRVVKGVKRATGQGACHRRSPHVVRCAANGFVEPNGVASEGNVEMRPPP